MRLTVPTVLRTDIGMKQARAQHSVSAAVEIRSRRHDNKH